MSKAQTTELTVDETRNLLRVLNSLKVVYVADELAKYAANEQQGLDLLSEFASAHRKLRAAVKS